MLIPADSSAEVYYAQDLGFFKAAGLDVRLSSMASSPAIVAALVSGAADVGNSVVGSAAAARARGIGVRFIAPARLYLATSTTSSRSAPRNGVARERCMAADAALRFAAAMRRTAAWANTHQKDSAAILLRYTKIAPDVAATMTRATYGTSLEPSLMQPVIDDARNTAQSREPSRSTI